MCRSILEKSQVTLWSLSSLSGNMAWPIASVRFAQAQRAFQNLYLKYFLKHDQIMSNKIEVSEAARLDCDGG